MKQQQRHRWSTEEHRFDTEGEKKSCCCVCVVVKVHPEDDVGDYNGNSDNASMLMNTDVTLQIHVQPAVAMCRGPMHGGVSYCLEKISWIQKIL